MAARHGSGRALRLRMGRAPLAAVCIGLLGLGACGGSTDSSGDGSPGAATDAVTAPTATDAGPATEPVSTDSAIVATDVPLTTDDPSQTDPAASTPPESPTDPLDFDDTMLEDVIAEATASPLVGLPGRDTLGTERLEGELSAAGFDLTGTELTIYPSSAAPGFVLLTTDDSSALLADESDDAADEAFVVAVLDSPAIADAGVERLLLRHSSTDDDGPFTVTFTVPLADLRAAFETGAEVFERIAVQVERP